MNVAGFALGLFALAFLLHWLRWRFGPPRRALFAMLIIFNGALLIGLLAAPLVPWLSQFSPTGFWQTLHVCLFNIAFSLAYIVLYSALEGDSPTRTIVAYVAAAAGRGRTREELLGLIRNEQIVGRRCDALCSGGIIHLTDGGSYVLAPKGRRLALTFRAFRRAYRLKKGG
jgi:MFS family permease